MNAFYDDFPLQTLSLFLASVIPGEEFAFCAGKKAGCKTVPDNPIKPLVYEVQPTERCTPNLSRISALLSLGKGHSSSVGKG